MNTKTFFLFCVTSLCLGQARAERFIVELSGEPAAVYAAKRGSSRQAATEQRARIAAEQQAARAAVIQRGGQVLTETDTVLNSLIVEHNDPEQLRAIPGVTRVYPVRRVKAALNRVIHLHQVIDAWQTVGGVAKAGLGIKIGILDTGIDNRHPWLGDPTLPPVEGFPKASKEANLAYTNNKVIVARSYEGLNGEGYGEDAADKNGHGTNAAAAAAGVQAELQGLNVSGVAPKAYLGNYKVLGDSGGGSDDGIIKGIDDAVKDGMDILNMSLGSDLAADPAQDAQFKAVEAACQAGVIVVAAAGNAGPDENTINSPGTAPCAITVGSSSSDRSFEEFPASSPIDPKRVSTFSSRGPNPGPALKPDLLAVGDNFLTAETSLKPDSQGFTVTQGTSFATPAVAGAAAVLKGAVQGRTVAQYRSHLISTATPLVLESGRAAPTRFAGAGLLNLNAAVKSTAAVTPTSLSFGAGTGSPQLSARVAVSNLAASAENFLITVESENTVLPALSETSLVIAAGSTAEFTVRLAGEALAAGEYQGRVKIKSGSDGREMTVPYWYAVASSEPAKITLLEAKQEGPAGSEVQFGVRVLDASGLALDRKPEVEIGPGGGSVVSVESTAPQVPGAFMVKLKLGPAAAENQFRIRAGAVNREITITGK